MPLSSSLSSAAQVAVRVSGRAGNSGGDVSRSARCATLTGRFRCCRAFRISPSPPPRLPRRGCRRGRSAATAPSRHNGATMECVCYLRSIVAVEASMRRVREQPALPPERKAGARDASPLPCPSLPDSLHRCGLVSLSIRLLFPASSFLASRPPSSQPRLSPPPCSFSSSLP